jgi:hypothetical protein
VLHEQLSNAIIPSSRHPSREITPELLLIPSQNYGCARNAAFVLPELNLELHGDERAGPGRLTTIRDIAEENQ